MVDMKNLPPVSVGLTMAVVATIPLGGQAALENSLLVTGVVSGTGPLTGLQVSTSSIPMTSGGATVVQMLNADFDSPDGIFLLRSTKDPHLTASGGAFQFLLNAWGQMELQIWAQSANGCNLAIQYARQYAD